MRSIVLYFALFCFFNLTARADEPDDKFKLPHITVSGYAETNVKPDIAHLRLGVVTEKTTPTDALSENSKAATSTIATLKRLGVDPKDIKTSRLSLEPVFVDSPSQNRIPKRSLTGYRVINYLDVDFRDVDRAGSVVIAVVKEGANVFDRFYFSVSDRAAKEDGIRADAVREAMRRATLYASGAKMKLGRLLAIDPEADRMEGAAADLPSRRAGDSITVYVPTEPGLEDIHATVSATWELVPQ